MGGGYWLFRVASTPKVGGGHMARCLSLAYAMAKTGAEPIFVLDRGGEIWLSLVHDAGFDAVIEGNEPARAWSGVLMDGYHFTDTDGAHLKALTGSSPLVFIDDFSNPPTMTDLVVSSGGHLIGDPLAGMPVLLGSRYALLGREYRDIPECLVKDKVQSVLVSFGRIDSKNVTSLALAALALVFADEPPFSTVVVLGSMAPHRKSVERAVSGFPGQIELLIDVGDMPAQLVRADVAIGSGGVSLMERMAAGVPSVTVIQADNQIAGTVTSSADGGTMNAGPVEELTAEELAEMIAGLFQDRKQREKMTLAGQNMVDGCGAERVAKAIHHLVLKLECGN